jgi:hypothetical protein
MKSVAQQLSEVCDNLKASGHTQLVDETLRQDAGKNLESKLSKLTTFAESHGVATRENEKTAHTALVEAAQKAFGLTLAEAEVFANPNRPSVDPKWDGLLKETK